METKKIIFFDGVCSFCNFWVKFAFKRNKKRNLYYAALQDEKSKEILARYNIDTSKLISVVFIDKGKAYTKSSAALQICKYLNPFWNFAFILILIPKFLRDPIYDLIGKNRYKWFGKKDACMIPSKEMRAQFL